MLFFLCRSLLFQTLLLCFLVDIESLDLLVPVNCRQRIDCVFEVIEAHTLGTELHDSGTRRVLPLFRVLRALLKALAVEGSRQPHHTSFIHANRVHMGKSLCNHQMHKILHHALVRDFVCQQDVALIPVAGTNPERFNTNGGKHLVVLFHLFSANMVKVERQFLTVQSSSLGDFSVLCFLTGLGKGFHPAVVGIHRIVQAHRHTNTLRKPCFQNINVLITQAAGVIGLAADRVGNGIIVTSNTAQLHKRAVVTALQRRMNEFQKVKDSRKLLLLLFVGKSQSFEPISFTSHHSLNFLLTIYSLRRFW